MIYVVNAQVGYQDMQFRFSQSEDAISFMIDFQYKCEAEKDDKIKVYLTVEDERDDF